MCSASLCVFVLLITFANVAGKDACIKNAPAEIQNTIIEAHQTKLCRYRDEGLFPYEVFRYRSGAGCYTYFPNHWFSAKLKIRMYPYTTEGYNCIFPIGYYNETPLLFDYKNYAYTTIISSSFKNEQYFAKWKSCAINADTCCNLTMNEFNIHPSPEYSCPTTWDAWTCFTSTASESISEKACPEYTSSTGETPCTLYSQKECFSNGTWNTQTDYSTCATAPVYRRRHNFHVIALYISIGLSVPAVILFIYYKNLRILRVNLHRNLLIACIVRSVLTIVTKEVVILDALKPTGETNNVLMENGVACRVLAYFTSVATNAIYACMLMDGVFLHKVIVRVFNKDPNAYIFYGGTIVLSFLPTTIWAIVVSIKANEYCWAIDTAWYQWIPDGFRIAILIINVILLGDIMRVLLMKLRRNVSTQHTKSTLKAMSFLVPLFGIPFILTASRGIVDNDSCTAGDIYYYVSYSIQSFQGVMVAVLFCYCNKEVHTQIRKSWKTINIKYVGKLKNNNSNKNLRRDTAATYVPNNGVSKTNDDTPNMDKKVNNWLEQNTMDNSINEEQQIGVMSSIRFDGVSQFIDDSNENLNITKNIKDKP